MTYPTDLSPTASRVSSPRSVDEEEEHEEDHDERENPFSIDDPNEDTFDFVSPARSLLPCPMTDLPSLP